MTEQTISQLQKATSDNDGFAMTLLGVLLINMQEDSDVGFQMICHAADAKNVMWAKDLHRYIRGFELLGLPLEDHALVSSDAREQMEIYVAENDYWAMAILGNLLYRGKVLPQERARAEELLGWAAHLGCSYAQELVEEYGISTTRAIAADILRRFSDKDNKKYWQIK